MNDEQGKLKPPLLLHLFSAPLIQREEVFLEGGEVDSRVLPVEELDYAGERTALLDAIAQGGKRVRFRSEVAKAHSLLVSLAQCRMLHFTGHGMQGYLALENDHGEVQAVTNDVLQSWVSGTHPLPTIVFVSACYSESVASAFISAGVKHVIAISQNTRVLDSKAKDFTQTFYTMVLRGNSVAQAFKASKERVGVDSTHTHEADKFRLLPAESAHMEMPFADVVTGRFEDVSLPKSVEMSIPTVTQNFVGRAETVQQVYCNLADHVGVTTVIGQPGAGKTQVALRAARYAVERFAPAYEEVFFVQMGGDGGGIRAATEQQLLSSFAAAFGFTPPQPSDYAAAAPAAAAAHSHRRQMELDDVLIAHIKERCDSGGGGRGAHEGSSNSSRRRSSGSSRPRGSVTADEGRGGYGGAGGLKTHLCVLDGCRPWLVCDRLRVIPLSTFVRKLSQRVPRLQLILTMVQQVGIEGEKVVNVRPLAALEVAELFCKEAPRQLSFAELTLGVYAVFQLPETVFSQGDIIRKIGGNPRVCIAVSKAVPVDNPAFLLDSEDMLLDSFIPAQLKAIAEEEELFETQLQQLGDSSNSRSNASAGISPTPVRSPVRSVGTGSKVDVQLEAGHIVWMAAVKSATQAAQQKGPWVEMDGGGQGGGGRGAPPSHFGRREQHQQQQSAVHVNPTATENFHSDVPWAAMGDSVARYCACALRLGKERPLSEADLAFLGSCRKIWRNGSREGKGRAPEERGGMVSYRAFSTCFWPWFYACVAMLKRTGLWARGERGRHPTHSATANTTVTTVSETRNTAIAGFIGDSEAEKRLRNCAGGTFLIRVGTSAKSTLVICYTRRKSSRRPGCKRAVVLLTEEGRFQPYAEHHQARHPSIPTSSSGTPGDRSSRSTTSTSGLSSSSSAAAAAAAAAARRVSYPSLSSLILDRPELLTLHPGTPKAAVFGNDDSSAPIASSAAAAYGGGGAWSGAQQGGWVGKALPPNATPHVTRGREGGEGEGGERGVEGGRRSRPSQTHPMPDFYEPNL